MRSLHQQTHVLHQGSQGPLRMMPGTVQVRAGSRQAFWVFQCWTQFFFQAPDFDPRGWVMVQFRAQSPNRLCQVGDLQPVTGKVKVAGALVHAAKFQKPVASHPTTKPTGTTKKDSRDFS